LLKYHNYTCSRRGRFIYKGYPTQQNHRIFDYFPAFFEKEQFDTVIEIGTSEGGLSLYVHELSKEYNFTFCTYDIKNHMGITPPFDFREKSAWDGEGYNEIIQALQSDKKVLLLTDGGDKVKEFHLYAPHLKAHDFIMTHDYAPSKEFHTLHMKYSVWEWCQNTDEDLQYEKYGLNKSEWADEFINVAWSCFSK